MSTSDWPAEEYAIGSFIQSTISDRYLHHLPIYPSDHVLDIGCGDGSYSLKIMQQYPMASFTGIDSSTNMLELAKKTISNFPNVTLKNKDVDSMTFSKEFDCILSFWCLQWAKKIKLALEHIYLALKDGGRFFALFPTGDDPYMLMYHQVRDSEQFSSLKKFTPPVDYSQFSDLREKFFFLPFINPKMERVQQNIILPSLDMYRKFVNGIGFYQGQIPTEKILEINEAMVQAYKIYCDEHYKGKFLFEFSTYILSAEK
jgi:ubiquinone/menaquinone biosynthesis C-methylase UbiE